MIQNWMEWSTPQMVVLVFRGILPSWMGINAANCKVGHLVEDNPMQEYRLGADWLAGKQLCWNGPGAPGEPS